MLAVNCSVTVEFSPIALILELLWFQYVEDTFEQNFTLALKMTDVILGSLETKCEAQHQTRLLLQVYPA